MKRYKNRKAQIDTLAARQEADGLKSEEWMKLLYSSYLQRMLSDNERIWRTGAIFVPLSLSALAALVTIKDLTIWRILVLQ